MGKENARIESHSFSLKISMASDICSIPETMGKLFPFGLVDVDFYVHSEYLNVMNTTILNCVLLSK